MSDPADVADEREEARPRVAAALVRRLVVERDAALRPRDPPLLLPLLPLLPLLRPFDLPFVVLLLRVLAIGHLFPLSPADTVSRFSSPPARRRWGEGFVR
jgi:hypothetical protein